MNGTVVVLVEIFKTIGFYTRNHLMRSYPLGNCKNKIQRNKCNQNQLITLTVVLEVVNNVALKYRTGDRFIY